MSKLTALFRLTFIVLLAGAGLSACDDFDEGRAASAWDKGFAAYEKGDYATALRKWQPLAEQGDAAAQNSLGWMYAKGQGVPQDDKAAEQWLRRAAEQGNVKAQTNLGWMYEKGQGVPQDDKAAVQWYRRAAEQGNAMAQNNLGVMYAEGKGVPQDDKAAVQWYRRAAEQGDADAQNNLGMMYHKGEGVLQDYKTAAQWYRRAAEQGHAAAQSNLSEGDAAARFNLGFKLAAQQLRRAAEQGIAMAQGKLGWMYAQGKGVPKDYVYAHMWANIAASSGNINAVALLNRIEIEMTLSQITEAQKLARECIRKEYKNCD